MEDLIINNLNKNFDLNPYYFKLYTFFVLYSHKYNTNKIKISQKKLGDLVGISKKSVKRAIDELKNRGILIITKNTGQNVPDSYEIVL